MCLNAVSQNTCETTFAGAWQGGGSDCADKGICPDCDCDGTSDIQEIHDCINKCIEGGGSANDCIQACDAAVGTTCNGGIHAGYACNTNAECFNGSCSGGSKGDGIPNACQDGSQDGDKDAVDDGCDQCPDEADEDKDKDGVADCVDNCPNEPNPGQEDKDNDGIGDACDPDQIPTVSEWGLIIIGVLTVIAGAVLFGRRGVERTSG